MQRFLTSGAEINFKGCWERLLLCEVQYLYYYITIVVCLYVLEC